jgi:hypothetical protein
MACENDCHQLQSSSDFFCIEAPVFGDHLPAGEEHSIGFSINEV